MKWINWGVGIGLALFVHPWAGIAWGFGVFGAMAVGEMARQRCNVSLHNGIVSPTKPKMGTKYRAQTAFDAKYRATLRMFRNWVEKTRHLD